MSKYCPLNKTIQTLQKDTNLQGLFSLNEFSHDIEFLKIPEWDKKVKVGKTLDDDDIIQIKYYLSNVHDFEPTNSTISDACYIIAKQYSYHPVKRNIESVIWDKILRCDEWLIKSTGCEDNYYTRMASAKFLIAAVSRIYKPGCKFDHMLILEGPQRIGKSTLVEIMAGDWFLDTNFENRDKDLVDSMRGIFIVEISELSGMNKKDIEWLKSFLSRKVDRVRLPYAQRSKDFYRQCVFLGTYNPSGNNMYLRDDTGNSRFWPIECQKNIDFGYLKENRGQLWAEALARYKNGEKLYIDNKESLDILSDIHVNRELESPSFYLIKKWLGIKEIVSMEDIIEDCLKINMSGKEPKTLLSISTTVGIIMRKLRWRKGKNIDNRDKYYSPTYHPNFPQLGIFDENH